MAVLLFVPCGSSLGLEMLFAFQTILGTCDSPQQNAKNGIASRENNQQQLKPYLDKMMLIAFRVLTPRILARIC